MGSWQQYGLDALAADQKSDGRTYYNAHAVVLKDSEMAVAHLDGDDSTDPFALLGLERRRVTLGG